VSALRLNSVLTKLTFRFGDAVNTAKLLAVLSELSTLKTLVLQRCEVGSGGAKQLGKHSHHCECIGIIVDIRKVYDSTLYYCILQLFYVAIHYTMCISSRRLLQLYLVLKNMFCTNEVLVL